MKHKAQEAFNYFNTQQCRNCVKLTGSEYSDLTNEKKKEVQQLFDCQLTEEEIGMIINCLSIACFNEDTYNSIFEKLNKQKEMWKEEEC